MHFHHAPYSHACPAQTSTVVMALTLPTCSNDPFTQVPNQANIHCICGDMLLTLTSFCACVAPLDSHHVSLTPPSLLSPCLDPPAQSWCYIQPIIFVASLPPRIGPNPCEQFSVGTRLLLSDAQVLLCGVYPPSPCFFLEHDTPTKDCHVGHKEDLYMTIVSMRGPHNLDAHLKGNGQKKNSEKKMCYL